MFFEGQRPLVCGGVVGPNDKTLHFSAVMPNFKYSKEADSPVKETSSGYVGDFGGGVTDKWVKFTIIWGELWCIVGKRLTSVDVDWSTINKLPPT